MHAARDPALLPSRSVDRRRGGAVPAEPNAHRVQWYTSQFQLGVVPAERVDEVQRADRIAVGRVPGREREEEDGVPSRPARRQVGDLDPEESRLVPLPEVIGNADARPEDGELAELRERALVPFLLTRALAHRCPQCFGEVLCDLADLL